MIIKNEKLERVIIYLYFILGNLLFLIDGKPKDVIKYIFILCGIIIICTMNNKNLIELKKFFNFKKYFPLIFLFLIFLMRGYSNFIETSIFIIVLLSIIVLSEKEKTFEYYKTSLFISLILASSIFLISPKYTDAIKQIFIFKFYRKIPLVTEYGYLNYSTFNIFLVLCGAFFNFWILNIFIFFLLLYTAKTSTLLVFLIILFCDNFLVEFFRKNSEKILLLYLLFFLILIYFMKNGYFLEINKGLSGREEIWIKYLEYFQNQDIVKKIIGNGWNTCVIKQFGNYKHPHNEFLQILINFGIIGFSYFICLLNSALKNISNSTQLKVMVSLILLMTFDCNVLFNFSPIGLYLLFYFKYSSREKNLEGSI